MRLPATLKVPRAISSFVSSGSSSYSSDAILCASTLAKLLPRSLVDAVRETGFFPVIGLPHRKDVAGSATLNVTYDHQPAGEQVEADDAALAVVVSIILDLERGAGKNLRRISEIEAALGQGLVALGGIESDLHRINVATIIIPSSHYFGHKDRAKTIAVAEKLSALRTEGYFQERAARADIPKALGVLERAGKGQPPVKGDDLPK